MEHGGRAPEVRAAYALRDVEVWGATTRALGQILGDTANTGARIEALGKEHSSGPEDCIVLAGAPTYERLHDRFKACAVGEVMLRGKERPVGVYRILDPA